MPKTPNNRKNGKKRIKKTPKKMQISSSCNKMDQIQVSKQLLVKRSSKVSSRFQRKNNASKTLETCKPMPPLAELEKMFEDSDNENIEPGNDENKTPIEANIDNTKITISPSTLQEISLRLMDRISKISDPSELLNELSHPPVVPPKKTKKPEEPYIVGCKDRSQVTKKLSTKFCKGSDNYGVDKSTHGEDDEIPKKRAKKSNISNVCKSLFNAKSDEIAEMLKDKSSGSISDSSISSVETVAYDYTNIRLPSFSPIPSTSKDHDTINKNDKMFINSFTLDDTVNCTDIQNSNEMELDTKDLEIIEEPIETIVLDDIDTSSQPEKYFVQQIIENDDNNSVQIIEPVHKLDKGNKSPEVIQVIDDYSSCLQFDNTSNDDVIEVIDIDGLIAESKLMVQKFKNKKLNNTVMTVDTSFKINEQENNRDQSKINHVPVVTCETFQNNIGYNMNTAGSVNLSIPYNNNQLQANANSSNYNQNTNLTSPRSISEIDTVLIPLSHDNQVTSTPYNMRNIRKKTLDNKNGTPKSKKNENNNSILSPSDHSNGDISVCPICMDGLKGKNIASTLCGHVFCMECIQRSVKSMGKKCPTCRKNFKGIGYHQIFL